MKKVFIKYNPYKLETEINVDGKGLAQNSIIRERACDGARLQEWIEELPQMLKGEYNDKEFDIEFHGTQLDYDDLTAVFTDNLNKGVITSANISNVPAKETADKEALINEVFAEIQQGPYDELRDEDIISAFNHAKSSDFELCVVATMSAGKSTLVNAMLGTKLMPSKQEACTAIITRIKDISQENVPFRAEVYSKENKLSETIEELTYPVMDRLNADPNVSVINVSGNIPFVSSDDVSLVLIDTPGPNNSRDRRHEKVQSELLGKSSKALVLYIMTGEFGTDDDNALLKRVAESMTVGGKQSKDRFIFVVNKLDERKKEDGDTNQTLERIRSYLKTHGVANPNLFPASALPALNIRLIQGEAADVDEDTYDETETKVRKLNRNEALHLEKYASLPMSIRNEINGKLKSVQDDWEKKGGRANENPDEALIHTGVVSIEAAIRQYVQKYAKTAKIKNIVDTFVHKLDEVGCFEKTKRELATHQEESERIVRQIESIQQKMDDAKAAINFVDTVGNAVQRIEFDSIEVIKEILTKYQALITSRLDSLRDQTISIEDVEDEVEQLKKFVKKLEPDFEVELDELIRESLVYTSFVLLSEYKKKLISLTEEMDIEGIGISIDPLKLMSSSIVPEQFSINQHIKEKEIEDGEEYIENTDKAWYKPWTWLQESGYYRTKYKTVRIVDGSTLAQEFFRSIERGLQDTGKLACEYTKLQSSKIAKQFNEECKRLDDVLKMKLFELKSYVTDKELADERVKHSEIKLAWLELINNKVESILEI